MDAESVAKEPLQQTMGHERTIELDAEKGRAVIAYRASMNMCHSGGVVQGGFVTGWIDAAMAHALICTLEPGSNMLTYEIKVTFMKPVPPGIVIAEGWVEQRGRSTAFLEGRLTNEAGDVLAKATSTGRILAPKLI